jgi:hypothetical protein
MHVKLGVPFRSPLFRMKADIREMCPSSAFRSKVAT